MQVKKCRCSDRPYKISRWGPAAVDEEGVINLDAQPVFNLPEILPA